jgi:hypothetical protein
MRTPARSLHRSHGYARPHELPPAHGKARVRDVASLDGYVDDAAGTLCMPAPRPAVFRHFIDVVAGHAGAIYGRRIYEVMRTCTVANGVRARDRWYREPARLRSIPTKKSRRVVRS